MPPWAIAVLPWIVMPIVLVWRARGSKDLAEYSADPTADAALVSIVVPARNEARNIERCLMSILKTTWPRVELFVVDDHSDDGTGEIARRIAAGDSRVTIIDAPPLPDGWFGKQWACHTAVRRAKGSVFVFTDADTMHAPALIARTITAMRTRGADMVSVMGTQELGTFWERVVMPQVFVLLLTRYGNSERMSRSTNPYNKIANGQFFVLGRAAYETIGGHEAVRSHVAEDMRIAQELCRTGHEVHIVQGLDYLSTRMYAGLGELIRGWGKNVYAAGRDTIKLGPVGKTLLRLVFPIPPLWYVAPALLALMSLAGFLPIAVLWWGAAAYGVTTLFWMAIAVQAKTPFWYGFLHPLGAFMMFVLFVRAAWRGDHVEWKGREYRSVSPVTVSPVTGSQ